MYCQMGNDHGKGNMFGEKKKKKHISSKESTHQNSNSSSAQEIQNGDLQPTTEDGKMLFLKDRKKREESVKDFVLDAERQEPKNQAGSGSQPRNQAGSGSQPRNEASNSSLLGNQGTDDISLPHNNTVTPVVSGNVNSHTAQDGSRSKIQNANNPNGSVSDLQGDSHVPPSTTHLQGSESDRIDAPVGSIVIDDTMPVNLQDLTISNVPGRIPQGAQDNTPPGAPGQTMSGSCSVDEPEVSHGDAPEDNVSHDGPSRLQGELGFSTLAPEVGSNSVNADAYLGDQGTVCKPVQTGLSPNHAPEVYSNMSNADAYSGGKKPTTGYDTTCDPEQKDSVDGVPQEHTEYISDAASSQSIPPTPRSKIESGTQPGMQLVPGLTRERSGLNEKGDETENVKVADQFISKAVTDNTLLLERLSKYLDRESRVIKCWKHLAFVLNVPSEETRKFDMFTEHSPTEDLFNYLGDIWNPDLKIKELKEKLKNVHRNDVIDSLNKAGFQDETNVGYLMFGVPKFIALLSPKLDMESRTIGNWRSLATQFGVRKQTTDQFGLRGPGPTGALFLHMRTTKPDLTMGELRTHFVAMERKDLVNLLTRHNCEDSHLVMEVVVDGSELLSEIGERLNKDTRAVKTWRNLAYKLKIPHEVYNAFDTSKGAAKSPTKMLFEWLARWKPRLNVGDLLKGLKQIERNDVVDLVTEDITVALANMKKYEANSRHDNIDGPTHLSTARQVFTNLRQMHRDTDKAYCKKPNLSNELAKNASDKGFWISHNPGKGNCMFFALAEQLELKKGIKISHWELRRYLVQHLKDHPQLPDETALFNFVDGRPSWEEYLEKMAEEGTWGDHVILIAAARCFNCVVRIISSLPGRADIIITPDASVSDADKLVLGHIYEEHYVSLVPVLAPGTCRILPTNGQYGKPPPCTTSSHIMNPQGYQQPYGFHRPQAYPQSASQWQGCSRVDKNATKVRLLPLKLYSKICLKLNIRRDWSFDDFRMVAEQLGMDRDTTEHIGQQTNPSKIIFEEYCRNVTVHELIEILHKIERMDAAAVLEEWIEEA